MSSDLRGSLGLAFDGVEQLVSIVEGMHANIAAFSHPLGDGTDGRAGGLTGIVYEGVRRMTRGVATVGDLGLRPLGDDRFRLYRGRRGEAFRAVLNGVVGDHLEATRNPLAEGMSLRFAGRRIDPSRVADAKPRVLLYAHGLCMNDRAWSRNDRDPGPTLAASADATLLQLRYNSGRHISVNGRDFGQLLEGLVEAWPVPLEEIWVVAHSMGGLVTRSAHEQSRRLGHKWPSRLRKIVFLGTPHHGAPLERHGNGFQAFSEASPYTAPLARLGKLRSAGITDLRFGSLLPEDWQGRDRFEGDQDERVPVPLPEGVDCYAIAASSGERRGDTKDRLLADGIVPVSSALGRHRDPKRRLDFGADRSAVHYRTGHLELLDAVAVHAQVDRYLLGGDASQ